MRRARLVSRLDFAVLLLFSISFCTSSRGIVVCTTRCSSCVEPPAMRAMSSTARCRPRYGRRWRTRRSSCSPLHTIGWKESTESTESTERGAPRAHCRVEPIRVRGPILRKVRHRRAAPFASLERAGPAPLAPIKGPLNLNRRGRSRRLSPID